MNAVNKIRVIRPRFCFGKGARVVSLIGFASVPTGIRALSILILFQSVALATPPLRIILEGAPQTLNPRHSLDATSQRLGALLFSGLTRLDKDMNVRPDLSERYEYHPSDRTWIFWLKEGIQDHLGAPITAELMARCMEEYRKGSPRSPLTASFPDWTGTRVRGRAVVFQLAGPDPFFPKNLSLLRYFSQTGRPPCAEPEGSLPVVGSGPFLPEAQVIKDLAPEHLLRAYPKDRSLRTLEFLFLRDDNTRTLRLLRGDADGLFNALSLSKSAWFRTKAGFSVTERDGLSITYLVFNMSDSVVSNKSLRQAIAFAIPREEIIKHKFFGFCSLANGLLPPMFEEARPVDFSFSLQKAEALLEREGFQKKPDGTRLSLNYLTSSAPIGIERAMILRDALRRVGIHLTIEVLEPAAYFARVKGGNFQVASNRLVGVSDSSIYYALMHTGEPRNHARLSMPSVDALVEKLVRDPSTTSRRNLVAQLQTFLHEEVPYLPLWFWNNALILRNDPANPPPRSDQLSLSGALDPLFGIGVSP